MTPERENDFMAETVTIRYRGSPARAGAPVQMLEENGIWVSWQPPQERRLPPLAPRGQGIPESAEPAPAAAGHA